MSGRVPPRYRSLPPRSPQVSPRLFRQRRLWMQLAAYRPLAVLAGIWIGLLAIGLLAYGQLLRTNPDTQSATAPSTSEPYPHERLRDEEASPSSPGQSPPATNERSPTAVADVNADDAVVADDGVDSSISLWTLLALVGSCALGCWVLSVFIKSPRRPRRRVKKGRAAKKRLLTPQQVSQAHRAQPQPKAAVPRLATYDPAQPLVAPTAPPSSVRPAPNPPLASPSLSSSPPAQEVSVVADEEQHRLDWPSDSLVNTADLRQRRSLSSYM